MESRVKEAVMRKLVGYNCAQAIACTYCSTICKELKGIEIKKELRPYNDCVADTAEFLKSQLNL